MIRILLILLALFLAAPVLRAEGDKLFLPSKDFVEYWSAARVHAHGGNPYSGAELLRWQQYMEGESRTQATMLWTPPWTLPLYSPFGLLEPGYAHLAWLTLQVSLALGSLLFLRGVYGRGLPGWQVVGLGLFLLLGSVEFHWNLDFGQNTMLLLFGLTGFLYCRTKGYPILAGVLGALTAVKPH
jgi:hypothetical protein